MHALDTGNIAACQSFCMQLRTVEPESPRVYWLQANASLQEGDIAEALRHTRVATRQASTLEPQQLIAVTRLMITLGEFESAWRLLEGLRHQLPQGSILLAIGEQLLMLERFSEALACLRALEKTGARHPMLSFLISSACRYIGDFAGAIESAEATLRLQPDFAHAHWTLSQLGLRDQVGARIDRVRRSITSLSQRSDAGTPQIQSARAMLWHTLFREFDSLDDRAAAWEALSNGLELKRALQSYDPIAEDRMFDQLIDTYSATFMQPRDQPVHPELTPIFIVGMPRTGTTLVERIITNHSRVAACGELNELQLLVKRATGHWSPEFLDATTVARLRATDFTGLGEAYLQAVAWRTAGQCFMVDKHQSNFLLAGIITHCLPHARIVHVRRDPLDACFSNLKEPFAQHAYSYSNRQRDVANHHRNYDRLMRHVQGLAGDRILEVAYEELARDRDRQSARILEFLGLAEEVGVHDITLNRTPVASASSIQVREPIHERSIGAWQRYASELGDLQVALGR